jgi:hypothetical protein
MTIKFTNNFTPSQYEETPEGFLRVKARVLAERVMPYARTEISDIPPELDGVNPIMMLVTTEDMGAAESIRTLEGASVVAPDHQWIEADSLASKKGNTVGTPSIDGPYLNTDLLITDPNTVTKIKNKEIGEISGAYIATPVFEGGEHDGIKYHARQTGLRWNHVAIIPFGSGRAGLDVRIINQKPAYREEKMAVRVKLRNTNRYINVEDEETAKAVESEQDAGEAKVGEAKEEGASEEKESSGSSLEALMKETTELKVSQSDLQAKLDEALGELAVYKEEIDKLMSDESMESEVEAQAKDSGEADEIIENMCMSFDPKKAAEVRGSFLRIGNTSIHKLRGTALHEAVLNAVGMKTENMAPAELKGAFKARLHMANTSPKPAVKTVAGAKLFNQDSTFVEGPQRVINKMWGKK